MVSAVAILALVALLMVGLLVGARDSAAVAAALEHEWSTGQVEGHVNTLKLVKRAAFGRAGFASLRRRVLRAAA